MGLFSALFDLKGCALEGARVPRRRGLWLVGVERRSSTRILRLRGPAAGTAQSWRAFSSQIFLKAVA